MTLKDLREQNLIIFESIVGSRLYHTNTEKSDTDILGVFVLPNSTILGNDDYQEVILSKDEKQKIDGVYVELRKFLKLLASGSPNAIETLFIPETGGFILTENEAFSMIKKERNAFITKNCKYSFGYSSYKLINRAQLLKNFEDTRDVTDYLFVLPASIKSPAISLREWNLAAKRSSEFIRIDTALLKSINRTKNNFSINACHKLDNFKERNITEFDMKTLGVKLDEKDNLILGTDKDVKEAESNGFSFMWRANGFFDKEGYQIYKKLKESAEKYKNEGYDRKALAHAYRLLSYGRCLANTKGITFNGATFMKEILSGAMLLQNLDVMFAHLRDQMDKAYADYPEKVEFSLVRELELTVRSRAQLLREIDRSDRKEDKVKLVLE